jgi:hypothetical protein
MTLYAISIQIQLKKNGVQVVVLKCQSNDSQLMTYQT